MVPFTKTDSIVLLLAAPADNDTSAALEPATGAASLEANSYEQFAVDVAFKNLVAAAASVSVQFYGSDAQSGDVSATWHAIGVGGATAPIVPDNSPTAATIGSYVFTARLHSREIAYKYVSAIATVTFSDQGAATVATAIMRGEVARRDE